MRLLRGRRVYHADASVDNSNTINTTPGQQDNPYVNPHAKGFRLPTSMEWELAARYQNGTTWTPGNHVSGDTTGYCYPSDAGTSTVFGNYAWYDVNSDGSTNPVQGKTANALSHYDMSGNVWEWCFDFIGSNRVRRGGCWYSYTTNVLQVGYVGLDEPYSKNNGVGFRPVRT